MHMKYPLTITIVTLAVFAFMTFIIITGTLTFHTPTPPTHLLNIASVLTRCPDGKSIAKPNISLHQAIVALCNGKATCAIDTAVIYPTNDTPSECTEEISLRFSCTPSAKLTQIFLYEGQHDTLQCEQND